MKLSAFTTITNPEKRGYPYLESIRSFANVFDEVVVVDGGSTDGSLEKIKEIPNVRIVAGEKWPVKFDWTIIGKNSQIGLESCTGDIVMKFDADYILHEKYKDAVRGQLDFCGKPCINVVKNNFVMAKAYFKKDVYPLLINKKDFPQIGYGIGFDPQTKGRNKVYSFLYPIVKREKKDGLWYGESIRALGYNEAPFEIFCYDFTFMTKEQVLEQVNRFSAALYKCAGKKLQRRENLKYFIIDMKKRMSENRLSLMPLEGHSIFIREKVKNLNSAQMGYNLWQGKTA